jgi:hypothetical protein
MVVAVGVLDVGQVLDRVNYPVVAGAVALLRNGGAVALTVGFVPARKDVGVDSGLAGRHAHLCGALGKNVSRAERVAGDLRRWFGRYASLL